MIELNISVPPEFLEEEERSGYLVTHKQKEVWAVELDLLQEFMDACKKCGVKCYADAGTLLGAVRHKGFIPWDDDIDLVMLRDDYEKLLQMSEELFQEPYFFQTIYTDSGYYRGHAQFRNTKTTAILEEEKGKILHFNQGIFIDIFVLDGIPESKIQRGVDKFWVTLINKVIICAKKNMRDMSWREKIVHILIKFFNISPKKLFDKRERRLSRYNKNEMVAPLGFIYETKKRCRSRKMYDNMLMTPFEFTSIPIPEEYDDFLKQRYGQYMNPQNVPTTHGKVWFDVDNSYKNYVCR